jgi:hypothetical protein
VALRHWQRHGAQPSWITGPRQALEQRLRQAGALPLTAPRALSTRQISGTTFGTKDGQPGIGVWAQAATPGGVALRADGPAEFNGTATFARSGAVTVPAGSTQVTRTHVTLAPETVVMATLQTRIDQVHLHAVETDPAASAFTVFLTAAPGQDVTIGWFAVG